MGPGRFERPVLPQGSRLHEEMSTIVGRELSRLSPHAVEVQGQTARVPVQFSGRGFWNTQAVRPQLHQSHSPQFIRVPIWTLVSRTVGEL
jgi:hypothetical protein